MKTSLILGTLGATLLAGCAGPLSYTLGTDDAELAIGTQVHDGGYRTQGLGFTAYTKSSIQHVVLALFTVSGGVETPAMNGSTPITADVSKFVLNQDVTFRNLHHATTYRVKAYAYKLAGTAEADLISDPASSSLDIFIGSSQTPTLAKVPVQLIDQPFSATGTSSLDVTDGSISESTESLSVDLGLTITSGGGPNFVVNGVAANSLTWHYTPYATTATVSLAIKNAFTSALLITDHNNADSQSNHLLVASGATASLTVNTANGALDVVIEGSLE